MPPKSTTGGGGAAPPDADERERKRAKQEGAAAAAVDASALDSSAAAAAAEARAGEHEQPVDRSAQILFLVLERQRHAARQACMAYRRELPAREALALVPGPKCTLGGDDDDDGEEGAVVGGGWWCAPPVLKHSSDDYPRRSTDEYDADGYRLMVERDERGPPRVPALAADRSFLETCSASARVSREWRSVAFAAADRATIAWEGAYESEYNPSTWRHPPDGSAHGLRLLPSIRVFHHGVLRALCLRGTPDDVGEVQVRAFALAIDVFECASGAGGRYGDEHLARVMRGLKVLRLEHAQSIVDALFSPRLAPLRRAPIRLCSPLPSPPLLSSLVSLDLERWTSTYLAPASDPSAHALFFARSHLPALRSLSVSLTGRSDCPFDLLNGASDDAAAAASLLPPSLTRLSVGGGLVPTDDKEDPLVWPAGERLMASSRSLIALAPTLLSLSIGHAGAIAVNDDGDNGDGQGDPLAPRPAQGTFDMLDRVAPMAHLVPCLSCLSRLSSLEIEADYDFGYDRAEDGSAWLLASRAALMPLGANLRRLVLTEGSTSEAGGFCHASSLPPAVSLLTALESLEVHGWGLSSAGPLRRLTTLRRLVIQIFDDDDETHSSILGRDLAPLSRLEFLALSRPEACWANVIADNLPRLSTLVLRDFYPQELRVAVIMRMRRDGLAVLKSVKCYTEPPRRLSTADLEALKTRNTGEGYDRWHEEKHQAAVSRAASMEAEDAAA